MIINRSLNLLIIQVLFRVHLLHLFEGIEFSKLSNKMCAGTAAIIKPFEKTDDGPMPL